MEKVDTTLFTKKLENDLFVMQIYVDDIIFGSINQDFCEEFGKTMASEFEMYMIGELSYFLDDIPVELCVVSMYWGIMELCIRNIALMKKQWLLSTQQSTQSLLLTLHRHPLLSVTKLW